LTGSRSRRQDWAQLGLFDSGEPVCEPLPGLDEGDVERLARRWDAEWRAYLALVTETLGHELDEDTARRRAVHHCMVLRDRLRHGWHWQLDVDGAAVFGPPQDGGSK
jgi:hypothetical protein